MNRDVKHFEFEVKLNKKLDRKIEDHAKEIVFKKGYLILKIDKQELGKKVNILIDAVYVGKQTAKNYYYCKTIIDDYNRPVPIEIDSKEVLKNVKEIRDGN